MLCLKITRSFVTGLVKIVSGHLSVRLVDTRRLTGEF